MSLARVTMKPARKISNVKLKDLAGDYFLFLRRNGQIVGWEWPYAVQDGVLNYYVELPHPDSLEGKYNSEWVRERLDALMNYLGAKPEWSVLDDPAPQRYPNLKTSPFLFLYSWAGERESPVLRGNDGRSIPLYQLPVDQDGREMINSWQHNSVDYYRIWFNSGKLEIPAWRQLSDPKSEHSQTGLNLCWLLEKHTKIPTYYYIHRYYAHAPEIEAQRPCPICGQPWRIERKWPNTFKRWDFEFKCDSCRLVSFAGVSQGTEEDERLARIGEYRTKKP